VYTFEARVNDLTDYKCYSEVEKYAVTLPKETKKRFPLANTENIVPKRNSVAALRLQKE